MLWKTKQAGSQQKTDDSCNQWMQVGKLSFIVEFQEGFYLAVDIFIYYSNIIIMHLIIYSVPFVFCKLTHIFNASFRSYTAKVAFLRQHFLSSDVGERVVTNWTHEIADALTLRQHISTKS